MPLVIQKYGGSSLADGRSVLNCARRVVETARGGDQVIVVVSAMGDATDDLIQLADQVNSSPDRRSLDLLLASGEQVSTAIMAMAVNAIGDDRFGCRAVALNINELGFRTDGDHCEAQITSVQTHRIEAELEDGRIVVVPGFQGLTPMGHIATLGRGGSDITAVALAAAMRSRRETRCEIYTDVDGVYTADPNLVPTAGRLASLSHDDMIDLATAGAKVLHPRSVLLARQSEIDVEVKLSPSREDLATEITGPTGTFVERCDRALETRRVIGCTLQRDLIRLSIRCDRSNRHLEWDLAQGVIEHVRPIEMRAGESSGIEIIVPASEAQAAEETALRVLHNAPDAGITRSTTLARVVVLGRCMLGEPQVLAALREASQAVDDHVDVASLSDRRIVLLTACESGEALLRSAHDALAARGMMDSVASADPVTAVEPASRSVAN